MGHSTKRLGAALALALTAASMMALPSVAGAATGPGLTTALAGTATVVTGSALVSTPADAATAVMTAPVGNFPSEGPSYAVLSTGQASDLTMANTEGDTSTNLGGANVRGNTDRDVTVLRVDFKAPPGSNCLLGVDFQFFTEEFPEYVGSRYNDAFIIELDQSTWTTNDSAIDAPRNIAFDPSFNEITVNAAGVTSVTAENAAGTYFDGATPLLRASTPITAGQHSLYFSIFDQGDAAYDSAVLIDNLRVGHVANPALHCKPGAQVVEEGLDMVALGDSFSSGEGAYGYDGHTAAQDCHRGPRAWPRIVEARSRSVARIDHRACTGAETSDLQTTYKGSIQVPDTPQPHVELVTLTIGGNDLNFSSIVRNCFLPWPASCAKAAMDPGYLTALTSLKVELVNKIYPAIRTAYPNARIVHVGYPRITPKPGKLTFKCNWLSPAEQSATDQVVRTLNTALAWAATYDTSGVEYLDIYGALDGQELCTMNSAVHPIFGDPLWTEQAHPAYAGQQLIAAEVYSKLGRGYR